MLLRRISNHIKRQDWVAALLDIAVVILGVFIGLQATAWNEDRQAKNVEHATLQRLQAEAEQVVAFWQSQVDQDQRANQNRRLLLEVLDRGTMTPDEQSAVDDALMRLGFYPQFSPPKSVYDELIAAGGLSRISDILIRNAVSDYAAELSFVTGQLTQFRTTLPLQYDAYKGRIFSAYAPEKASMRRYEYDIAVLADDRQFVSVIIDSVRDQLQFFTYRESILKQAIMMCEAVSRALSISCDPPGFSEEEIKARDGVNR